MMEKININDASIAEEIRKQMAVATSQNNGLLSSFDKTKINAIGVTMSQSGGEQTLYYHLARLHRGVYDPIMIEYAHGSYDAIKTYNNVFINYWGSGMYFSSANKAHAKSIFRYREEGTKYIDVYMIITGGISCIANINSKSSNLVDITYSVSIPNNLSEF